MNYSILERGLITEEQLKKISYLSFSNESKQIVALLTHFLRKLKKYQKTSFILETISTFFLFIILSSIPLLLIQEKSLILLLALIYIVFHALVIYFRLVKLHYLKKYSKVVEDLGDNLLSVIFDDYKLSLGEKLPDFFQVKEMTRDIADTAFSLREYLRFIKEMIGIILGLIILMALGLSLNYVLFTHLAVLVSVILVLYSVHTALEATHSAYEHGYRKENVKYDRSFLHSHPLLTRTRLGFEKSSYLEKLKPILVLFDNINAMSVVNKSLLPILLLFLPLLLDDVAEGVYLLVVGLFISNRLFSIKNPVLNRAKIIKGEHRLRQLNFYLDTILDKGSEITPHIYKKIRKELFDHNSRLKTGNRIIWGDLNIEGLTYFTGWGKNKKRIYIDKISLPYGKVSLLVGDYGVGKTLFGRVVTLRYSNFNADVLAIGNKDLRSFKSLDEGLKYLHYSCLRKVSTSYRNALSVYIKDANRTNIFVRKVFNFEGNLKNVKQHFIDHKDYYGDLHFLLGDLLDSDDLHLRKKDLDRSYSRLVADLYQNFSHQTSMLVILKKLKNTVKEDIFNKGLILAAVAEYISYNHLKNYVPEANIYYMDANLSKPPISQNARLRFLYAIDVFMEGLVLVVDEPFSKTNPDLAKIIFNDLVTYAQNYNAVVLILDEKIHYELVEENKSKGVLGKILRFENDGFSLNVKANDLE